MSLKGGEHMGSPMICDGGSVKDGIHALHSFNHLLQIACCRGHETTVWRLTLAGALVNALPKPDCCMPLTMSVEVRKPPSHSSFCPSISYLVRSTERQDSCHSLIFLLSALCPLFVSRYALLSTLSLGPQQSWKTNDPSTY